MFCLWFILLYWIKTQIDVDGSACFVGLNCTWQMKKYLYFKYLHITTHLPSPISAIKAHWYPGQVWYSILIAWGFWKFMFFGFFLTHRHCCSRPNLLKKLIKQFVICVEIWCVFVGFFQFWLIIIKKCFLKKEVYKKITRFIELHTNLPRFIYDLTCKIYLQLSSAKYI